MTATDSGTGTRRDRHLPARKDPVAARPSTSPRAGADPWWRDAVIYQIYPRSFADGDGDGFGDLPGATARLDHLAGLGVDAVWLSPFYPSPQADAGYDVADHRDVDPLFGSLDDFDALLRRAHDLGLRVIIDLVPNHTSDEHPWFRAALAAGPGSDERARYLFRDGRGPDGAEPPNGWQSVFGGPAWTRVLEADGTPGQWYLHLFDTRQPDLDWNHPGVRREFEAVLRFWLDRGVDGFRVDVAHGLVKAAGLPDWSGSSRMVEGAGEADEPDPGQQGPMWDQDGVHDIYRAWRRVLDGYDGERVLVAEAWVSEPARLVRYVRPDEFHQAFNFRFLVSRWNAGALRRAIHDSLSASAGVGAVTTWVLSNHDVVRTASRLGLSAPGGNPDGIAASDEQPDEFLGERRARAAAMLMLALPGSAYLYQGEELGLPDHTALPDAARQDPSFHRTGGRVRGRDGCRVPIPWEAGEPAFGFSPTGATWLPQPPGYARLAVDRQQGRAGSTLELYRAALRARRRFGTGDGGLRWLDGQLAPDRQDVLAFSVGDVLVVANLGTEEVPLPPGEVVLRSVPEAVSGDALLPEAAVWLLPAAALPDVERHD